MVPAGTADQVRGQEPSGIALDRDGDGRGALVTGVDVSE